VPKLVVFAARVVQAEQVLRCPAQRLCLLYPLDEASAPVIDGSLLICNTHQVGRRPSITEKLMASCDVSLAVYDLLTLWTVLTLWGCGSPRRLILPMFWDERSEISEL